MHLYDPAALAEVPKKVTANSTRERRQTNRYQALAQTHRQRVTAVKVLEAPHEAAVRVFHRLTHKIGVIHIETLALQETSENKSVQSGPKAEDGTRRIPPGRQCSRYPETRRRRHRTRCLHRRGTRLV